MSKGKPFSSVGGFVPAYPAEQIKYAGIQGGMFTWEADDWQACSLSWKESCYIHAGISGTGFVFRGPDAQKLLSKAAINNVYKWKDGYGKHLVMLDEQGLVSSHGLVIRDREDNYRLSACNPWPILKLLAHEKYDVEVIPQNIYIFQFSGPLSLTVLEKVTGESLRDVQFLQIRKTSLPALDLDTEIQRIGMSGTLAYELRGPAKDAPTVYSAVYEAGREYGMKRLGWRTYIVNHTEGGFPQVNCSFQSVADYDPEFANNPANILPPMKHTGSVDPADNRARFRTPCEAGWQWMASFNHDFVGREALEREMAHQVRTIATIKWNAEDVVDVYASLLREGEAYKYMEMPSPVPQPAGGHADYVTDENGKVIGYSSDAVYSYYYHAMISQVALDMEFKEIGTKVFVQWGDFGGKIKNIRATVEKYPYIDLPSNKTYNLSDVPQSY